MIRARPSVEALQRYVAPLEGRRGLLRLDFNENTLGPSPKVVEAIRSLPPEAYATYPEYSGLALELARYAGVPEANLAVFNGADAAIRAVFDAFGSPGETFLTTHPTFGYYAPCAAIAGMTAVSVPYDADLEFPWAAFARALAERPRLALICNPNNPTSTLVPAPKLLELAAAHPGTLFVIDEIYAPYTGVTVLPEAIDRPNVLALRTLSKSAGLAALRIGFACGASELVERVYRVTGPYDINAFAVIAAKAALSDPGHTESYVAEVAAAKEWTLAELGRLQVRHFSQGGNYCLVWPGRDVAEVERELRADGILVRSMAGKPLIDGSFRLTIGTREQMRRFVESFERIIGALG